MTPLFILQLVCCTITAMLATNLAMARLQIRWKVGRYEVSSCLLSIAMLIFSIHYFLQLFHGFRAQGPDVGCDARPLRVKYGILHLHHSP